MGNGARAGDFRQRMASLLGLRYGSRAHALGVAGAGSRAAGRLCDFLVHAAGAGSAGRRDQLGWTGFVKFFALVTFVWAMPTEYAAAILLETDERYCGAIERPRYQFRQWLRTWMPAILGALVFVCMLGSVVNLLTMCPALVSRITTTT